MQRKRPVSNNNTTIGSRIVKSKWLLHLVLGTAGLTLRGVRPNTTWLGIGGGHRISVECLLHTI